jgi:CRISPR-associated protein Cas6
MPTIDLAFELVGATIPLDHGYALYAALSRLVPALHGDRRMGVHPIRGRRAGPGVLSLLADSRLRIRLPSEDVASYLAVAGARLDLDGHTLRVGVPRVEPLVPAAHLAARLVTFRHALTADALLENVHRELVDLGIHGVPSLVPATREGYQDQPLRRVLRIKGKRIVGYALHLAGLTAEESIGLQEVGLGGRRRMGCGIFVPSCTR